MGRKTTANRCGCFNAIKELVCKERPPTDTGKGKCKLKASTTSRRVSHGFHLVEGKSGHDMEDYHVAEYQQKSGHVLGLFAIFDGHLGDRVPRYLKHHLLDNILKEPKLFKDPETAMKNAYQSTNQHILKNTRHFGPGGSTAVSAIVVDGQELWVANVGDSRGVMCHNGSALQLTVDHEPQLERKRIEKQGGFITAYPGDVPRVNGQLAISRTFGDENLKALLSSEPHFCKIRIDSSLEFVILASDGLWKVMDNEDSVNLIRNIKDPQTAAKRLTTEALARKSKDDISCIVIRFD